MLHVIKLRHVTKLRHVIKLRHVTKLRHVIKLRRLKSTRAEACIIQILRELERITQNEKDWESFKLNHKHSHSPEVLVDLQQH